MTKKQDKAGILIFISLWKLLTDAPVSVCCCLTLHHWWRGSAMARPETTHRQGLGSGGQGEGPPPPPCYKQLIFHCPLTSLSLYVKKYLVFCYFCVFTIFREPTKTKDCGVDDTLPPTLFCLEAQRLASGRQTLPLQPG